MCLSCIRTSELQNTESGRLNQVCIIFFPELLQNVPATVMAHPWFIFIHIHKSFLSNFVFLPFFVEIQILAHTRLRSLDFVLLLHFKQITHFFISIPLINLK